MSIENFFLKGYQILHDPGLEKIPNMAQHIGDKYLSPVFPNWNLIELAYAEEVRPDDRITVWHNDSKFGMNITFLYYIDEMNPDIGGSISISNGSEEETVYPKYGTLIMLSQKLNMQHKVGYTTHRRRMYNIDYLVEGY